jgi:phosphoglycerate kinase
LPMEGEGILSNERLVKSLPTIRYLLKKECRLVILGYRGRPGGEVKPELSLKPVYLELMSLLEGNENMIESVFVEDVNDAEKIDVALGTNQIVFLENVRFWPEEEQNDVDFLAGLVEVVQAFVNDAFAESHRKQTSITLFRRLPAFYGFDFIDEVEHVRKLIDSPKRPLVVVLGGAKEDKLKYLGDLKNIADKVLVGGKLPKIIKEQTPPASGHLPLTEEAKIMVAKLKENGLDLSDEDIKVFTEQINSAETIVWIGAMGFYESEENKKGTEEIARVITNSTAYKVIAGGDTWASIEKLGLRDKIDFVCSGGGVLLEFLTKGTLPAWE